MGRCFAGKNLVTSDWRQFATNQNPAVGRDVLLFYLGAHPLYIVVVDISDTRVQLYFTRLGDNCWDFLAATCGT